MRALNKNKRLIYYAMYLRDEMIKETDEWGNVIETGEMKAVYGEPTALRINVSAAQGESSTREFGELADYDRVLVTTKADLPIEEKTILWIDQADTTKPHDYVVTRKADSLNSVTYAVKKVNVQ